MFVAFCFMNDRVMAVDHMLTLGEWLESNCGCNAYLVDKVE